MRHPRYCLTHHPGIFSNITNATRFSTPAMPITLAHRPFYPRWCNTHATYASTSPTLARQQSKHTTHVSTTPCKHFNFLTFLVESTLPYSKDDYFFKNKCATSLENTDSYY